MQHTVGIAMSRSPRAVAYVAAITAVLCLLSACASIGTPRAGEPVVVRPGEALVFGRIRMLDAKNEKVEHSAFWFDPWDQPFFAAGPRMSLQLRQFFPPGGMYRYRVNPTPAIEKDGTFFWILAAGDYELLGNPRLYGSENFSDAETMTLARFRVPASGGTTYLGTLIINITYGLEDVVSAWKTDEAEYDIRGFRVVDDREQELSRLRARFPVIPEPVTTGLMVTD
jgi:hypothetical protein